MRRKVAIPAEKGSREERDLLDQGHAANCRRRVDVRGTTRLNNFGCKRRSAKRRIQIRWPDDREFWLRHGGRRAASCRGRFSRHCDGEGVGTGGTELRRARRGRRNGETVLPGKRLERGSDQFECRCNGSPWVDPCELTAAFLDRL